MPYGTGCKTLLSNFEAGQNYKTEELAQPTTAYELLRKTKKLKSGEWANDKAKDISEGGSSSQEQHSPASVDSNAIYLEVVGGKDKKGHMYGLGQLGNHYVTMSSCLSGDIDMASIPPEVVEQMQHRIIQLTEELAEKDARQKTLEAEVDELRGTTGYILSHLHLQPPPPPSSPPVAEDDVEDVNADAY